MFKLYKRYKEAKQATPEENAAAIEAAKARILAAGEDESPEFEMIFRDALSAKDNRVRYVLAAYPGGSISVAAPLFYVLADCLFRVVNRRC